MMKKQIIKLIKIFAFCIIAAMLSLVLKSGKSEFSFLIAVITVVIILSYFLSKIFEPVSAMFEKLDDYGVEPSYFKVALKALGIGYLTNFSVNICKDAGQSSIASAAEMIGKGSIFILSMPLVMNIIDLALGFIK